MTTPEPGPRLARRRTLVRALAALAALLAVSALVTVVLPAPADRTAAGVTVGLLLAIPVIRVSWLGVRWWRLGDRRFALVTLALLGVVTVAAVV